MYGTLVTLDEHRVVKKARCSSNVEHCTGQYCSLQLIQLQFCLQTASSKAIRLLSYHLIRRANMTSTIHAMPQMQQLQRHTSLHCYKLRTKPNFVQIERCIRAKSLLLL